MGYSQNSLTSCIYEIALGRCNWDNILDILSATFPNCLILVSGDDLVRRKNLAFGQRGLSTAATGAYMSTYAPANPWLSGQATLAPSQVYHDDQLLPREVAFKSVYWTEWLSKQGDYSAATGVVILREGARQLTIEIRYPSGQAEIRERAAAILGEAAQHFARAFEIAARSRFAVARGYLGHVVEDLPFAAFFVDADLRIHYANNRAHTLRGLDSSPFSRSDGFLRATDPRTDTALRELVSRVSSSGRIPASVMPIAQPGSDDRFFAIARRAVQETQNYQLHDAILDPGPMTMLVVHGNFETSSLSTELLWRAFSLSESESRLAEALLSGATLADFARERQVSKQTLRNQLVGIMRKTGTRRQSELVSLFTRLALTCV